MRVTQDRGTRPPLTISEQLAAASTVDSNVIELSNGYHPPPPDPLAVLKEDGSGWADPEQLAEAARYCLRGGSEAAFLRGIGLALLAIRAEIRDGRAER
jgi:hypothetical protein